MADDDMYDFGGGPAPGKPSSGRSGSGSKAKDGSGGGQQRGAEQKSRVTRDPIQGSARRTEDAPINPVPRVSPGKQSRHKADEDEDEYGDDDFEDYGDDFEDDDDGGAPAPTPAPAPAPAPAKAPVGERSSAKSSKSSKRSSPPGDDENSMRPPHTTHAQESAQSKASSSSSSSASSSSSSRPNNRASNRRAKGKQFGEVSMSLGIGSFGSGAKAKRLASLQQSGVMDMQIEKFTNFSIPAGSAMDRYRRMLTKQNPTIRQFGVPADEERRSVEVATEDLSPSDKGVQACYGDDTEYLDVVKRITDKQLAQKRGLRHDSSNSANTDHVSVGSSSNANKQSSGGGGIGGGGEYSDTNSLVSFLQRASQVCERLIDEGEARSSGLAHLNRSATSNRELFSPEKSWVDLSAAATGAHELIRLRPASSVHFSTLQPHLLISTHPYVIGEEDDLLPFKGVCCVWDAANPSPKAPPTYVMSCAGTPTCAAFSCTQSYLIAAATEDGTVHLWDLREASSLHRDRDSSDLGIDKGVRKPCFSTPMATFGDLDSRNRSNNDAGIEVEQHSAPVTHIEAIGDAGSASSSTSQFASLDTAGTICLWMTTTSRREEDPGLSPWGRVALVLTRALHVGGGALNNSSSIVFGAPGLSSASALCAIPGDVSTLLTAAPRGVVKKVVRFGQAPAPALLERQAGPQVVISEALTPRDGGSGVNYYSDVTCIGVQDTRNSSSSNTNNRSDNKTAKAPLVLIGRVDGTVDLFQLDVAAPLQTWSVAVLASRAGSSGSSNNRGVKTVRWLPNRPTTFVIVDTVGSCFVMDLLLDPHSPVCTDRLLSTGTTFGTTDFSACRLGTSTAYAAFCTDKGNVNVRPLNDSWTRPSTSGADGSSQQDLVARLQDRIGEWSVRTADAGSRAVFSGGSSRK